MCHGLVADLAHLSKRGVRELLGFPGQRVCSVLLTNLVGGVVTSLEFHLGELAHIDNVLVLLVCIHAQAHRHVKVKGVVGFRLAVLKALRLSIIRCIAAGEAVLFALVEQDGGQSIAGQSVRAVVGVLRPVRVE